jgi:hypothetical protein
MGVSLAVGKMWPSKGIWWFFGRDPDVECKIYTQLIFLGLSLTSDTFKIVAVLTTSMLPGSPAPVDERFAATDYFDFSGDFKSQRVLGSTPV